MGKLTVSGLTVEVVRKDIRNLHLGVYPPNGRVRVAAPLAVSDAAVRLAVIGKLGWIRRQQARFAAQPRESRRRMVSGESHDFLGRRYRLRVRQMDGPGKAGVLLRGKTHIEMRVRSETDADQRERLLQVWYREQLKALVSPLLERWQEVIGVRAAAFGVRRMKTKWGSCNVAARRIWLNLELAKKPVRCVEYILVHELVHLRVRRHDDQFTLLMDRYLPGWRARRDELNRGTLGHETWGY